jgi:hypothetical protein
MKLAANFAGPCEIIEVISPVAYRLHLPVGTKAHDVFHASMLKPYHGDANTERVTLPPRPVFMQDGCHETLFRHCLCTCVVSTYGFRKNSTMVPGYRFSIDLGTFCLMLGFFPK